MYSTKYVIFNITITSHTDFDIDKSDQLRYQRRHLVTLPDTRNNTGLYRVKLACLWATNFK